MNPLDQYEKIQSLVQKEARDIANDVLKNTKENELFGLDSVTYHVHSGTDSPQVDYNSLLNKPTAFSMPSGTIMMYGGSSAPTGYLFCDGTAVSRTTYSSLFGVISTTYGAGDASTTFNVPDMRGRAPIGVGTGTGGGASGSGLPTGGDALTARSAGDWLGEQAHILDITQIPSHNHATNPFPISGTGSTNSGLGPSNVTNSSFNTGNTGGGLGHNNIQPVMTVQFIIKT